MKKIFLLTFAVFCMAINIDINSLEKKISSDPNDIKNRLIAASYYLERNKPSKAEKYIKEILKKDPKNKYALKFKSEINYLKTYTDAIKKFGNLNKALEYYYTNQKYEKLLKLYIAAKNLKKASLNEKNKINVARVAMWKGKYDLSLQILSTLKNKKTLDYYEITAYDLFYKGEYKKAEKYFRTLYETTSKTDYATKLMEIYFYLGDVDSAQKLLLSIKRTDPKTAKKFERKIELKKQQKIINLRRKYEKNPSFKNLQALAFALYPESQQQATDLVKEYIHKKPNDKNAKVFLAKLLSWSGKNDEALKYLQEFQKSNDLDAKLLLGKILAWQGDYDKAALYLSDVYEHGNKTQKYEAEKMLGYMELWKNNKANAKKIFSRLYARNPNDDEIKEVLMVLNKNVKPLIKKYKKLLNKNPGNEEYILKLADYYYMLKDYNNAAIYYEQYLKKHPEKLEVYKTLGDIYLQLKNYYKGFGYLEYYANYKNTKEAYLDLAKRYYWNGFNKEALKVLDDLLKKYPNYQEALILKAKILKINPRFVNSSTAATIDEYYAKRSEKILALGDRAYFANLYKSAADYYKEYLFLKPDDYDVREKYAYALEASKENAKAAGEFYLLMWYKKTPIIEYHYAYNLQKSGQLQKAKKIYENLLQNVPKPVPEFLKEFLNKWKKAWESMNFEKYASFYDKSISNKLYWRLKKQAIFNKASFISVGIYDPMLISQKNDTYMIKFFQVYASKNKKDKGYKTLVIKCKNKKNCKIIKETWEPGAYTPYNPNNSLEKYILQNLNLLKNDKPIIKLIPSKKKINENKTKNTRQDVKKKDIVLAPSLKKAIKIKKEAEVLNYTFLKKEIATRNNIIQTSLIKSDNNYENKYDWEIYGYLNYFKDNQDTKMITGYARISHAYKDSYPFIFYKQYDLSEKTSDKKGFLYGAGIKKEPFLLDVFIDKSGKNTIGWDLEYYPNFLNGIIFKINKHNMVYSRKSICSSKHTKIKFEATGYKTIESLRALWWSVAFEHVDDSNNVLTPQLEYDLKHFEYKKIPITVYFSGWYQLNTKQTSCYYSPDKTDTNIIGIKTNKNFKRAILKFKGGVGYSFLDNTFIYNYGIWLYSKNITNLEAKAGCDFSNSSAVNKSSNYKSMECEISLRKVW